MTKVVPRSYQFNSVNRFLQLKKPRRMLFGHVLSAGKSFEAMYLLQELSPARVLIVTPAVVRPQWERHLRSQFPNQKVGVIKEGKFADGSKPAKERRAAAYAAPWKLVSYGLLNQIPDTDLNFLIFDEIQALRSPGSQQSKAALDICRANPDADVLMLSGTPAPNEARQIFNPIDILAPGYLGPRTKTDGEAWNFLERYCHKEWRHGHPHYHGCKDPEALRKKLEPYLDIIDPALLAKDLPQLTVEPLYLEKVTTATKLVKDWRESIPAEAIFGVFTHLRETAREVAALLGVPAITGDLTPEARDLVLQASKASERPVVGTVHSLNEGIDLSFIQASLVLELQPELAKLTQFIGRFARQGGLPCRVDIALPPGKERTAEVLRERISTFSKLFAAGRAESLGLQALAEKNLSDDEFAAAMAQLAVRLESKAALRGLIEQETDDDEES